MKKNILILLLSSMFLQQLHAEDIAIPDLQQINSSVKNIYAKVEDLDKSDAALKYFLEHPVAGKEQQDLLLETYRLLANGYSQNNHFKQGYVVYQRYLSQKETFLAKEKADAITNINIEIKNKQKKSEDDLLTMQNGAIQLQLDNEYLLSKRKSFKHYFSLGIIALTVVFAFLLLQAGLMLTKLKHDVKAGRDRLRIIHRIAVLGKAKKGVLTGITNSFSSLKNLAAETISLADKLNQLPGEKSNELTHLRKQMSELKDLLDK